MKDNYKYIELDIEKTTKKQRTEQYERYQSQMEKIESLKQNLKTEINSRKETEEMFMVKLDNRTKEIQNSHKLTYLNNIYKMKE